MELGISTPWPFQGPLYWCLVSKCNHFKSFQDYVPSGYRYTNKLQKTWLHDTITRVHGMCCICVIAFGLFCPWTDKLWWSYVLFWYVTESILIQVMACCLMCNHFFKLINCCVTLRNKTFSSSCREISQWRGQICRYVLIADEFDIACGWVGTELGISCYWNIFYGCRRIYTDTNNS